MTAALRIPNRDARRLWLHAHGLGTAPTGAPALTETIDRLGFVQLDSIQVVARAHHHILWSRDQTYREPALNRLLHRDRAVFEHFTHDASVLPIGFLPLWRRQFARLAALMRRSSWFGPHLDEEMIALVRARIAAEGPLCSADFDTKIAGPREMWKRPPHKIALDYLWYSGELATCHRRGFAKVYDLAERVFPADLRKVELSEQEQIDGLCNAALTRIGFGTPGEVRKFWDAVEAAEVADWADRSQRRLTRIGIEATDGTVSKGIGCADLETRLAETPPPTTRLRILSPFDPAIRDRARLKRLFGFDYTVEMFVPAEKRRWGYYVYPLLEGDRFVGRIEARANRADGVLEVLNLWAEPRVRWTGARAGKLDAELARLARFAGLEDVRWQCPPDPR